MAKLLAGTVTLVFSDLEGSTALLTMLGPAYAEVLSGQRVVLRQAWTEHGGVEMGTEGDSFFVVFATAPAAVRAAVQAQRGLAARHWPAGVAVRVRMGIHTGSPNVHDGGYVGIDVHRAARIAASAHGGQVVVSAATAELLASALPADVWLSDLGSHQMKDIPQPERLLQVNADGLPNVFPPLRTITSSAGQRLRLGLPDIPGNVIGRQDVLNELAAMAADPVVRLITVLGAGGVGKTRLAQELVLTAPGDATFVSLVAAERPDDVAATISVGLGIEVTGEAGQLDDSVIAALARYPRELLLVLDNFEHLLPAAAFVGRLLREVAGLTVVITSRVPLNLSAEQRFPLDPLETAIADGGPSAATALLLDRMRRIDPRFRPGTQDLADAAEIGVLCEGLPLAIEIAAARTNVFSLSELRTRLSHPLSVLVRPGANGQRGSSVESSIEWSMSALPPDVSRTLALSSIFRGGFTAAALSAVAGITEDVAREHLHYLLEHSLINALPTPGQRRFDLLQVVREVAVGHLDDAEHAAAADGHVGYFRALVGPQPDTRYYPDTYAELELISVERPNLRAAVRHAATTSTELMADLVVSLGGPWLSMGAYEELHEWIKELLDRIDVSVARRIDLLLHLLHIEWSSGRPPHEAVLREAKRLANDSDDRRRLAMILATSASFAWETDADIGRARSLLHEAVLAAGDLLPDDFRLEFALIETRAFLECDAAQFDKALGDFRAMDGIAHEHGLERLAVVTAVNLSFVLLSAERFREALDFTTAALAAMSSAETENLATVQTNHGQALLGMGNHIDAVASFASAARTYLHHGSTRLALEALLGLTACQAERAPDDPAAALAMGVFQAGLSELTGSISAVEQSIITRHLNIQQEAAPDSVLGRARADGAYRVSALGIGTATRLAVDDLTVGRVMTPRQGIDPILGE